MSALIQGFIQKIYKKYINMNANTKNYAIFTYISQVLLFEARGKKQEARDM